MLLPDEIELKTFSLTRRGFDPAEVRSFLGVVAAELRSTLEPGDPRPETRWWICTRTLASGGRKILGPFGTRTLALQVRSLMEQVRGSDVLCVDEEPARG